MPRNDSDVITVSSLDKSLAKVDDIIVQALGSDLSEFLRQRLSGGKRLRPRLLLLAAGDDSGKIIKSAAALEMIHKASKLHDDLLDESVTEPTRYLLGGDLLISAGLSLAAQQEKWIAQSLSYAIKKMIKGEHEQTRLSDGCRPDDKSYQQVCILKTASLFGAAAMIGGRLGGMGKNQLQSMDEFGRHFGLAYQISDDLADGCFSGPPIALARAEAVNQLDKAIGSLKGLQVRESLSAFAAASLPGLR